MDSQGPGVRPEEQSHPEGETIALDLSEDLLREAEELGLKLSEVVEQALKLEIERARLRPHPVI